MKTIKKIKIYLNVLLPVIAGLLLLSYGNTSNHPTINGFIVESFLKKNNKEGFSMSKFKNYQFDFEKPKLKGDYITESGLFNPSEVDNFKGDQLSNFEFVGINPTYTEESREVSPKKWIEHGGFSADVPEVPASLRHFYDPTRSPGDRYLTDKVNSKAMSWFQSKFKNPKTDGLEWALGSGGSFGVTEHVYTWETGKKYMKAAFEEPNPDRRKNYMAKAWRSLGETLHMIADNGCPPHVRNDGHPSIPIPMMSYFGNPDPYEEIMHSMQETDPNALLAFKGGMVPASEADNFRKAKTARDVAHELAVFTNRNFFTNETICGTDWKGNKIEPITHPTYVYPSPKLEDTDYRENYYRKEIGGQEVLMCTDTWFLSKYPISKTHPYVDEECVKSQAKVLIPTITEAGVNVMKLFVPALMVEITELNEDGSIKGEISHTTDKEYQNEIKYNGPVIIRNQKLQEVAELKAENGKFEGKITNSGNSEIFAEIECGGITIKSERYTDQAISNGLCFVSFNMNSFISNKPGEDEMKLANYELNENARKVLEEYKNVAFFPLNRYQISFSSTLPNSEQGGKLSSGLRGNTLTVTYAIEKENISYKSSSTVVFSKDKSKIVSFEMTCTSTAIDRHPSYEQLNDVFTHVYSVKLQDLPVYYDNKGQPSVYLNNEFSQEEKKKMIVSISHEYTKSAGGNSGTILYQARMEKGNLNKIGSMEINIRNKNPYQ